MRLEKEKENSKAIIVLLMCWDIYVNFKVLLYSWLLDQQKYKLFVYERIPKSSIFLY
ncbi:hypothetical protein Stok01_01760 [Sulfurisphaera tokodaii]